jgi:hypothetical protein
MLSLPDPKAMLWSELAPLLRVVHELEFRLAMLGEHLGVVAGVIALAVTTAVLVAAEFRARGTASHPVPSERDASRRTSQRSRWAGVKAPTRGRFPDGRVRRGAPHRVLTGLREPR